jgi:hypothetical protein
MPLVPTNTIETLYHHTGIQPSELDTFSYHHLLDSPCNSCRRLTFIELVKHIRLSIIIYQDRLWKTGGPGGVIASVGAKMKNLRARLFEEEFYH